MQKPNLLLLIVIGIFLFSCGSQQGTSETPREEISASEEEKISEEAISAVCIWDKIAVREEPSAEGKWLTSISLGESLESLGTVRKDSGDQNREYLKVRLADGTEGWSIADFIVSDAKVAVFLEDNAIYKRPDLLTKTENNFSQMDIVAVKSSEGEWLEVVGKRRDGKWIESGWVKEGRISTDPIDVAVAKFTSAALEKESKEEQIAAIEEILANVDFKASSFLPVLQMKMLELKPPSETNKEIVEEEVVSADTVSAEDDIM